MAESSRVNILRGQIGTLVQYNHGADWNSYQERLEQYFLANYVEEDRRVAVLITAIGEEAYEILKGLCDPILPKDKPYTDLCRLLKDQFTKKVSVFKERVEFYEIKQFQNEQIKDFFVRLKNKAIECKFGIQLNEVLKDRFVSGLESGPILDRLCEEEHTITLQAAVEIALKKEATLVKVRSLPSINALTIHKSKTDQKRGSPSSHNVGARKEGDRRQEFSRCNSCGRGNHNFSECKYKKFKCRQCLEIGHLAKVCKNNKNSYLEPSTGETELPGEQNLDFVDMYFATANEYIKPVKINMLINKIPFTMELDSGAGISVIPEATYREKLNACQLKPTNIRLRTYNGSMITPVGEIQVETEYGNISANCRFVVIENGTVPLLGRDLMNVFNFKFGNPISELNNLGSMSLEILLEKYKDLFDGKLGLYKYEKIELKVDPNCKPIFCKPRPIPFSFKESVNKELDELERTGVVKLVETSEWATPLVPVVKSNGEIRLCADYKITVNRFMQDVKHPLPRIEELFAALQGGENFTKLDLASAYNQLELTEETKKLLSWSTHKGIYQPNRLPYGTKPACSIFQKVVEKVLLGIPGVINFLDDILVTGSSKEEHLKNLDLVFDKLSRAGFKLNLKKSEFFKKEIKYLGHIITKEGLQKDPDKIKAIRECPRPQNVSEIKAYAGMVNYYGRFVGNLSSLLEPLYRLLRNDIEFKWSSECEKAFKESKIAICSDVSLAHFDPDVPVKLICDASKIGLGAVLLHVYEDGSEKPICFASRLLNKQESSYSVIHKEALAIFWGVHKFYQFLMGRHFFLCSDHKPLLALFGEHKGIPQMAAGRLQRWALFLSGFNYTFKHIKGSNNGAADGLSRMPLKTTESLVDDLDYFNFLVEDKIPINSTDIKKEIRSDTTLSTLFRYVRDGWPREVPTELKPYSRRELELSIDNDLIMWGYRLIIPPKFRSQMLQELHGAHMGIVRMKSLARQYVWWPGLDSDIEKFVKQCEACMKNSASPAKATLIKFNEGKHVFDRIHIDFLGPFHGKTYLIITDSYSKWPEVYEMFKVDSANTIDKLRDCFARYGLPNTIVSDNGTQFTSNEFKNFCSNNGILHVTTAPYHPSTNGAAENSVKTFKCALNKLLSDKSCTQQMNTLISKYLFSYRNSPHCSTGQMPSKLMFSRKVKTRFDFLTTPDALKARDRQIKFHHGGRMSDIGEGEVVYVRDYRYVKPLWTKCIVIEKLGLQHYLCSPIENENLVWKRHLDQIIKVGQFYENMDERIPCKQPASTPDSDILIERVPNICKETVDDATVNGGVPELVLDGAYSSGQQVTENSSVNVGDIMGETIQPKLSKSSVDVSSIKNRLRQQVKPPDRLNL